MASRTAIASNITTVGCGYHDPHRNTEKHRSVVSVHPAPDTENTEVPIGHSVFGVRCTPFGAHESFTWHPWHLKE